LKHLTPGIMGITSSSVVQLGFLFLFSFQSYILRSQKPVLTTNIGHAATVTSISVSSDDQYIVSGSDDMTIKLWDMSTGKLIRSCSGHTDKVNDAIFSSDDRYIISCSDDHSVKLWDVMTGKEIRSFAGHTGPVKAVDISSDNRYIVSGGMEDTIRLWDLSTGSQIRSFILSWELPDWMTVDSSNMDIIPEVYAVTFSSDNKRIASWENIESCDTIRVWNVDEEREKLKIESYGSYDGTMMFCNNDSLIVSGGMNLSLWDSETGELVRRIEYGSDLFDLSLDGRYAVIANYWGYLTIVDMQSGCEVNIIPAHSIYSVAFSRDGRFVITGSADQTIKIYDLDEITNYTLQDVPVFREYATDFEYYKDEIPLSTPVCFDITKNGKHVFTGTSRGEIKRWDTESQKYAGRKIVYNNEISALKISNYNRYIATAGGDHAIQIMDMETGESDRSLQGHNGPVSSLAISPDDRYLVSGSWDSTINLWDLPNGSLINTFKGHQGKVTSVDVSPDNRYILSGSEDATLRTWDINGGTLVQTIDSLTEKITVARYSPDYKYIITCDESKKVKIRDAVSFKPVYSTSGISFDLSTDGRYMAVGEKSGLIDLFDLENMMYSPDIYIQGKYFHFSGIMFPVEAIAFSPDNKGIFACSRDGIRYWEIKNMYIPLILGERHVNPIQSIDISDDGKYLAVGSDNFIGVPGMEEAVVRLMDLKYGKEVKRVYKHPYPFARIHSVVISSDNSYLAAGVGQFPILYDLNQQELVQIMDDSSQYIDIQHLSISKGSEHLAIAKSLNINIVDIVRNQIRSFYEKNWDDDIDPDHLRILTVQFSSGDDRLLGTTHDGEIRIWDFSTGEEILYIKDSIDNQLYSSLLSTDNRYIYTGHRHWENDSPVKKWDATTGELLQVMTGHKDGVFDLALTADNSQLLSASFDHTARMWDAATGKEIKKYTGHNGEVTSLAISPGEDILFTGSYDGSVRMWDMETASEIATLYLVDSIDWLLVTPQGLFDATPGGMDYIQFVQGMEIIGLNQLKERYWEPGLMQKLLGHNDEPIRDVAGLNQLDLYPEVSVKQPVEDEGVLNINLTNRGGGIGKVHISINGKEITQDARDSDSDPDAQQMVIQWDINNHPYIRNDAVNIIEVKACNKDGYLVSRGKRVYFKPEITKTVKIPDLYIVSVGVSDYSGTELDLRYAAKDAGNIATAFEIGGKRLFGTDHTYTYLLSTNLTEDLGFLYTTYASCKNRDPVP